MEIVLKWNCLTLMGLVNAALPTLLLFDAACSDGEGPDPRVPVTIITKSTGTLSSATRHTVILNGTGPSRLALNDSTVLFLSPGPQHLLFQAADTACAPASVTREIVVSANVPMTEEFTTDCTSAAGPASLTIEWCSMYVSVIVDRGESFMIPASDTTITLLAGSHKVTAYDWADETPFVVLNLYLSRGTNTKTPLGRGCMT